MKEFVIDGEKTYWGDQCSEKFRKRTWTDRVWGGMPDLPSR
jgi:hypothetical protein